MLSPSKQNGSRRAGRVSTVGMDATRIEMEYFACVSELEYAEQNVQQLEQEKKALQETIRALQTTRRDADRSGEGSDPERHRRRIKQLEEDLRQKDEKIEQLSQTHGSLEDSLISTRHRAEMLETQYRSQKEELAALKAQKKGGDAAEMFSREVNRLNAEQHDLLKTLQKREAEIKAAKRLLRRFTTVVSGTSPSSSLDGGLNFHADIDVSFDTSRSFDPDSSIITPTSLMLSTMDGHKVERGFEEDLLDEIESARHGYEAQQKKLAFEKVEDGLRLQRALDENEQLQIRVHQLEQQHAQGATTSTAAPSQQAHADQSESSSPALSILEAEVARLKDETERVRFEGEMSMQAVSKKAERRIQLLETRLMEGEERHQNILQVYTALRSKRDKLQQIQEKCSSVQLLDSKIQAHLEAIKTMEAGRTYHANDVQAWVSQAKEIGDSLQLLAIQHLVGGNSEASAKVKEELEAMQEKLSQTETLLASQQERAKELEGEADAARAEQQALQTALEASRGQFEAAEAQLVNIKAQLDTAQADATESEASLRAQIDQLETAAAGLEGELEESKAEHRALQQELAGVRAEVDQGESERAQLEARVEHLAKEATKSVDALRQKDLDLDSQRALISDLHQEMADNYAAKEEQEKQVESLQSQLDLLRASESAAKGSAATAEQDLRAARIGIEELEARVLRRAEQIGGLQKQLKQYEEQIEREGAELKRLRNELDKVKTNERLAHEDGEELLEEKEELEQRIAELETRVKEVEAERDAAQQSRDAASAEAGELKSKLAIAETDLEQARDELAHANDALKDAADTASQEKSRADAELASSHAQLDSTLKQLTKLDARVRQLTIETGDLISVKVELAADVRALETRLVQAEQGQDETISQLREEVARGTEELTRKEADLDEVKQQLEDARAEAAALSADLADKERESDVEQAEMLKRVMETEEAQAAHAVTIADFQKQIAKLEREVLEKVATLDQTAAKLRDAEAEAERVTSELERSRAEAAQAASEQLEELQRKYDEAEARLSSLSEELAQTEETLMADHAAKLYEVRSANEAKLIALQTKARALEEDLKEARESTLEAQQAVAVKALALSDVQALVGVLQLQVTEAQHEQDDSSRAAVNAAELRVQNLTQALKAADQRASDTQAAHDSLTDAVVAIEAKRNADQESLQAARGEVEALKTALAEAEASLQLSKDEVKRLNETLQKGAEDQMNDALTKLDKASDDLAASQARCKELEEAQLRHENQVTALNAEIHRLSEVEQELESSRESAGQLSEANEKLVNENNIQIRKADEALLALENVKIAKAKLEAELGAQIREAEAQKDDAVSSAAAFEAELERAKDGLAQAQNELSELQHQLTIRDADVQAHAKVSQDLVEAKERIGVLESEIETHLATISDLHEQRDRTADDVAAQQADLERELTSTKTKLDEVSQALETAQLAAEQEQTGAAEMVELRERIAALESDVEDAEARVATATASSQERIQELEGARARLSELETVIVQQKEAIASRNEEYWTVKEELAEMQEIVERSRVMSAGKDELSAQLEEARQALASVEDDKQKVEADLVQLSTQHEALKAQAERDAVDHSKLKEMESRLEAQAEALLKYKADLATYRAKLADAEQHQQDAPSVPSDAAQRIADLEATVQQKTVELQAAVDDLEEASTRELHALKEQQKTSKRYKSLLTKHEELYKEKKALDERLASLQAVASTSSASAPVSSAVATPQAKEQATRKVSPLPSTSSLLSKKRAQPDSDSSTPSTAAGGAEADTPGSGVKAVFAPREKAAFTPVRRPGSRPISSRSTTSAATNGVTPDAAARSTQPTPQRSTSNPSDLVLHRLSPGKPAAASAQATKAPIEPARATVVGERENRTLSDRTNALPSSLSASATAQAGLKAKSYGGGLKSRTNHADIASPHVAAAAPTNTTSAAGFLERMRAKNHGLHPRSG